MEDKYSVNEDMLCEIIPVEQGKLIITRKHMALQTPDGVLHPADLDAYGQYEPILGLMRLISCDADLSSDFTDEVRSVLRHALLGEHPLLSHLLSGYGDMNGWKKRILEVMAPITEEDFVRTLCLLRTSGLYRYEDTTYPFVCREELCAYLCQFISKEHAYQLSETVRKGLLYGAPDEYRYKWDEHYEQLRKLPVEMVNLFSRIMYLPSKFLCEMVVRYAIIAAKSLIENDNCVIVVRAK